MKSGQFYFSSFFNMSEKPPHPEGTQQEIARQEIELSPEVIEKIMEKVEDINEPDTAFHVLNAERPDKEEILIDVLRDGILGQTHERRDEAERAYNQKKPRPHTQRGAYVEDVKSGKMPRVSFDIVGRMSNGPYYISEAHYMESVLGATNIAIIFDLTKFSDGIGTQEEYEQELETLKAKGSTRPELDYLDSKLKMGTFWPGHGGNPSPPRENDDLWSSDDPKEARTLSTAKDYGHVLMGRVSPRHFKGIVLKVHTPERRLGYLGVERDPNIIQEEVKKIVDKQRKVYRLNPDKILPIYDIYGNLLWPKQMSREDIEKEEEEK